MVKKEALINGDIPELKRLSNHNKETPSTPLRQAQGQVDFLIIGQGISGTWLSYYLQKENRSFLVIDNNASNTSSKIAAGIINPVTGRRHVEVWMAEEVLPFANNSYKELGIELGITTISQKNIIDFFPGPQIRVSFMQRLEEKSGYLKNYPEQDHFLTQFNYDLGCGEIDPVYTVHLDILLPAWRQQLVKSNAIREEEFDINELIITTEGISYKDITASKIIFCDGTGSTNNPYFNLLPFAPNKGELLIAEIPDLPPTHIYKKGTMLVPLSTPGLWWVGSSYAWEFDNPDPTPVFKEKTEAVLKEWLKVPFRITEHLAGVRPATLERRPFVGMHPVHSAIGILNGMGTKGCSLAPFFAKQLTDHLCYDKKIAPEADVNRFRRILSKS